MEEMMQHIYVPITHLQQLFTVTWVYLYPPLKYCHLYPHQLFWSKSQESYNFIYKYKYVFPKDGDIEKCNHDAILNNNTIVTF